MSAQYTGAPDSIQSPCPVPGPGVKPIVTLPADTDGATWANIYQPHKVDADFLAFIQSALRLDITQTPASGSGYTTVGTSSSPAWTGTVTPSGARLGTGHRIFIRIIAGGAVGAATFQTSLDGGVTFGGTQTTAASMVCATSGITLAFTGTLTTNAWASFMGAYTPQAQWVDKAGNLRWAIDHNGYPMGGGVSRFEENWLIVPGASGSPWATSFGTSAAIQLQDPIATYNAPFLMFIPSSTSGATNYSLMSTARFVLANTPGLSLALVFDIGLNASAAGTTSNTSWFWGLDVGTAPDSDVSLVGLRKKYNNTNYDFLSGAGGLQAVTASSPPTPPTSGANPVDRVCIELHGSASPLAAYQARFFVNGAYIGTVTSGNLPGATALRLLMGCYNEGGAPSGTPRGYMGPVVACWNRFAAGVAF